MDSEEPQQPAVGEPAGQQLKRARESHGLSQKDVADAQHLRVSIIQAIEEANYQQIDSELFLKGYVRAYAKQVGADADALIETLDLELEPLRRERVKQEQENPLVDIERRRLKKRRVAKTLGMLVFLGAIALAVWKLVIEPRMTADAPAGQEQTESGQADESQDTGEAVGNTGNDGVEVDAVDVSEAPDDTIQENDVAGPDAVATVEEPEVSQETSGSMDNPVVSVSDYPAPGSGESEGTSDVANENEAAPESPPEPEPVVNVEPAVDPDPVFAESAQPESVATSTELEMSFVSDCWVQVTDSSGARLVASLQRDGDSVSVSGRAPFEVVIGAVDAVDSVSFGGEPVDLSDFRVVNNRTEFTLTL